MLVSFHLTLQPITDIDPDQIPNAVWQPPDQHYLSPHN